MCFYNIFSKRFFFKKILKISLRYEGGGSPWVKTTKIASWRCNLHSKQSDILKTLSHFDMFWKNCLSIQQNFWNVNFDFTDSKRCKGHLLLVVRCI